MAIQIVKDNERNEYKVDGSTIYYTRISTAKRGAIIRKHTKRGKVNWVEVTNELVQTVVIGWDGVQDSGKDIAFDKDIALLLPDEILSDILELSGANIQTQEESAEKKLRDYLVWQAAHRITCEECRKNYEEDDRDPPCEEKGFCPINAVEPIPENLEVIELYRKIKAFGPEMVFKFVDLTLTETEAEDLMDKLITIDSVVNEIKASEAEQRDK